MSSKRDLKRMINYVCSDLFAECVAASLYSGKPEKEDSDALLSSIVALHSQYIRRISHVEPGLKPRDYFKDLVARFNNEVSEIVDQISSMN